MKPLTLETAIKKEMTPTDCVQYYRPDWSKDDCFIYLWEYTMFPLGSIKRVLDQLNEHLNK